MRVSTTARLFWSAASTATGVHRRRRGDGDDITSDGDGNTADRSRRMSKRHVVVARRGPVDSRMVSRQGFRTRTVTAAAPEIGHEKEITTAQNDDARNSYFK